MADPVPPLEDDLRWRRLMQTGFTCTKCGVTHKGLLDLAADSPEHWEGGDPEPNSEAVDRDSVLTEDFCVIDGRDHFVRCVLQLPILGGGKGECFAFGVWSTLSPKNFALYQETFDLGTQGELGPWFGWFSNRLKGYPDTLNLKCQVRPQNDRRRPLIELEPTDHPLAVEQREGVTLDRVLELLSLNGHDLRTLS
jgi:hypothetical protein